MTVGNWVSFDCINFSANLGLGCTFMPNKIQSLKKKKLFGSSIQIIWWGTWRSVEPVHVFSEIN